MTKKTPAELAKLPTTERRRLLFEQSAAKLREAGWPISVQAQFESLIEKWIAGDIPMRQVAAEFYGSNLTDHQLLTAEFATPELLDLSLPSTSEPIDETPGAISTDHAPNEADDIALQRSNDELLDRIREISAELDRDPEMADGKS